MFCLYRCAGQLGRRQVGANQRSLDRFIKGNFLLGRFSFVLKRTFQATTINNASLYICSKEFHLAFKLNTVKTIILLGPYYSGRLVLSISISRLVANFLSYFLGNMVSADTSIMRTPAKVLTKELIKEKAFSVFRILEHTP